MSTNRKYRQVAELLKLRVETRNKVRALLGADEKEAMASLNALRRKRSAREVAQIEKVLRDDPLGRGTLVPQLFPAAPQVQDHFHRTEVLPLHKQIELIAVHAAENIDKIQRFTDSLAHLNESIIQRKFDEADLLVAAMLSEYGYSHLLLRKAALIIVSTDAGRTVNSDAILASAGLDKNFAIPTSLLHCYKEEFDHLSVKRSIMNLGASGAYSRFTRDICRIVFHPFAKDSYDLSELLLSAAQSSLIDSIQLALVNNHLLSDELTLLLSPFFSVLERAAPDVDAIAALYEDQGDEGEHLFYKHSSAWLESRDVISFKALNDTFYDQPEAEYNETNPRILSVITSWVADISMAELATSQHLTRHSNQTLRALENAGTLSRSAVFNLLVLTSEGDIALTDEQLVAIMGRTRDLAKTINTTHLSHFARLSRTKFAKLILYLLIAKKSKNEFDDHHLRRLLQEIVINEHSRDIVKLFEALQAASPEVATYAYEVCTEDFIAKLYHLVESPADITETRANLHRWMGGVKGEQIYFDRARTILIDHQLNKIRGEIDDNRIYVDITRFLEWFNDEAMGELTVVLAGALHRNDAPLESASQIVAFIEKCYFHFCSNKIFGIASYLGRRIRHGTFKGHLYSGVISLERNDKYKDLMAEANFQQRWSRWKEGYEGRINDIIRDRLHVESSTKKDALIKPTQNVAAKLDTLTACARAIATNYLDKGTALGSGLIIAEYCWRLAEIDLKSVNAFLKNQKAELTNISLLNEMKTASVDGDRAKEFVRELIRAINEKFMAMYNWFKRPVNVSPKASVPLLYRAVVAEVQATFPDFSTPTDYVEDDEIELMGGAYHVLYDSLYVVVYNAAKHGKQNGEIRRTFQLAPSRDAMKALHVTLTSDIKDVDGEVEVSDRLTVKPDDDISNAQLSETRSGLRKLHHLQQTDKNFRIEKITCEQRQVTVSYSYALEH